LLSMSLRLFITSYDVRQKVRCAMMPNTSTGMILLALATLAVAGCSPFSSPTPVAAEPDLVGTRIAQAAEKASQAMDTISGIEQQRTPLPPVEDYSTAPASMTQPITVRWNGPIEQITQTLASRAGLQFRTQGRPPAVPITVVVDVYQIPLIEVLRSIGLQAGHRADINADGQAGVILIRYAPADRL
jgi:defect-in-organelle-trafficking protein DotD